MNPHNKINLLQKQMQELMVDHWIKEVFLSWGWWIVLCVSIVWSIVWWKFVDRKRLTEILLYGLFVALFSTFADVLGWNFGLWTYFHNLIPMCTPILPMDLIVIPMAFMLVYQRYTKWSSFLVANTILAFVFAFIGENILEWMEFYIPLKWKHIYSVPGYIVMAVFSKWFINKIKSISINN